MDLAGGVLLQLMQNKTTGVLLPFRLGGILREETGEIVRAHRLDQVAEGSIRQFLLQLCSLGYDVRKGLILSARFPLEFPQQVTAGWRDCFRHGPHDDENNN